MRERHEWKHEISAADRIVLCRRLETVMRRDAHAGGGTYAIRSLYFDTPRDKALREKLDGVDRREKFRLRLYNGDTDFIRLECKRKRGDLSVKDTAPVTAEEVRRLLAGERDWMADPKRPLVQELGCKMRLQGLAPKVVVTYRREPFVYAPGNVRVTLDDKIRTCGDCAAFLAPAPLTLPVRDGPILLEVKWDAFLPDIIRRAVALPGRRAGAYSKYAAARAYG